MDKITISVFTDIENPFSMTQCDQPDDHHCNLVICLFASNLSNSYLPHRDKFLSLQTQQRQHGKLQLCEVQTQSCGAQGY